MRGPLTDSEDVAQDVQLDALVTGAKGRHVRKRAWIEADRWRQERGRDGTYGQIPIPTIHQLADHRRAPTPELDRSLVERAIRAASSLPIGAPRSTILLALRCIRSRRATERVAAWIAAHPGRRATHAEIAAETGLRRETVTRAIGRLRR